MMNLYRKLETSFVKGVQFLEVPYFIGMVDIPQVYCDLTYRVWIIESGYFSDYSNDRHCI